MIRLAIFAAFLGAMAYLMLFVDLGGRSLYGHFRELIATPAIRERVDIIKEGVKAKLEEKLAEAKEKAGKATHTADVSVKDDITEADRAELFQVLKKAGVKP